LPTIDPSNDKADGISLAVHHATAVHEGAHEWNHRHFPWADVRHPVLGKRADEEDYVRYESTLRKEVGGLLQDHVVLGNALMPGAASSATPSASHDEADYVRYESTLRKEVGGLLQDHVVLGNALMPGAGFLDILAAAGAAATERAHAPGSKSHTAAMVHMEDVLFERPLSVPSKPEESGSALPCVRIQVDKSAESDCSRPPMTVEILSKSQSEQSFATVGTGRVVSIDQARPDASAMAVCAAEEELKSAKERCTRAADLELFYGQLSQVGLRYGPRFQTVSDLQDGSRQGLSWALRRV
ncbi:unnamed protein product, partial [Vitrella brassicaformis CCMP3155]